MVDLVDAGDRRHQRLGPGGDDDGAGRDDPAADLHLPRRAHARLAAHALHPELGVALHRVVRRDLPDDPLHAVHHLREVEVHGDAAKAELLCPAGVADDAGRANEGLGRHAAGVEAVPAHAAALDEAHAGLDRRGDIGGDEPGRARADDHEVAIEARRPLVGRQGAPLAQAIAQPAREQGEQRQQDQGGDHVGGQHTAHAANLRELGAGIHKDDRRRQHPDLADQEVHRGANRRQPHGQVDQEVGEQRHEAQREQVVGAVAGHATVDGGELTGKARPHGIAEDEAREQEGRGGAECRGEGHQHRAEQHTEQRAGDQRQHCGARQRQARHEHVDQKEAAGERPGIGLAQCQQPLALGLEALQCHILVQIEQEERGDERGDERDHEPSGSVHDVFPSRMRGISVPLGGGVPKRRALARYCLGQILPGCATHGACVSRRHCAPRDRRADPSSPGAREHRGRLGVAVHGHGPWPAASAIGGRDMRERVSGPRRAGSSRGCRRGRRGTERSP